MDRKKLGLAIIGSGVAAGFHSKAIAALPDLALRGIWSPGNSAREFARREGVVCYDTLQQLLADERATGVCICSPTGCHARQAIAALQAGKHVLIEKPVGLTAQEGALVAQTARDCGRKAAVVAQLRCFSGVQQLRAAISQGRLGKITLAQLDMVYYRSQDYYDTAPWRGTWAMDGGGALMNQGIHGIDLLLYLLGPVKQVFARAETMARAIETEDTAAAMVVFESGALCTVAATTSVWPGSPRRLRICGTKGTVVLTEDSITEWSVEGEDPGGYVKASQYCSFCDHRAVPEQAHIAVLQDFARAIRTGQDPISTAADGFRAVALIEAMYRSSRTGQSQTPVRLAEGK